MFKDDVVVPRSLFFRKAPEAFRLPNQALANARQSLEFVWVSEAQEVDLVMFCAFLAMFGPSTTAMRKVADWLKVDDAVRENILPVDMSGVEDLSKLEELEPVNSFSVRTKHGEKTVFNLVAVENDGQYLVDSDGQKYGGWAEFVEANPPLPPPGDEEEDPLE